MKQTSKIAVKNKILLCVNVKSSYCRMPPKADYWKYFTVQGLLALCQIEGCPKPTVSLGS